jgi:hypothetical protein
MKSLQFVSLVMMFSVSSSSAVFSQEPAVQNVRFTQRADSNVEVTYDLIGNPAKKYSVRLSLVKSGSRAAFPISKESLSGNVGQAVSPGRRLIIIWNLPKDYPRGLEGEGFVFIVEVFEPKRGSSAKPWIIGGLTAVGGGVAILIAMSGGGGGNGGGGAGAVLPLPPDFPQ